MIIRVIALLALVACFRPGVLVSQPIGPAQMIEIEHADSLVGTVAEGGAVRRMFGNVRVRQGVLRITADRAELFESQNRAELIGDVRIEQPGLVLTGPRIVYDGNSRLATAPAGVTLIDNGATLRAGAGTYEVNTKIARFRSGVTLQDQKNTLRAGSGDYFSNEARAEFRDNVQVENDSGTIQARRLTHWRVTQESFAVGNVVLVARKSTTRLTGDSLRHRPADGYTVASGRPKLVRIDTSRIVDASGKIRRDTTIITALRLESFRAKGEEYVATDSVRLRRGALEAIAALARYAPDSNRITLGPGRYGDARAIDTANLTPASDSGAVAGRPPTPVLARGPFPVVWYEDSQLTGDSIVVGLEYRKLRFLDVLGRAFAVTEGKQPGRFDQLAGSRLTFDILHDTIRQVRSEEFAASIVFIYDGDRPQGANRQSGDTINIAFEGGEASTVRVTGRRTRAEGEYFPERLVAGSLSTYRLEGFRYYDRSGSIGALNASTPRQPAIPEPAPPHE